jgi:heat shock protein HtpX
MNTFKTGILMIALTALLIFVGYGLGSAFKTSGLIYVFFIMAVGVNLVSYWYSDKIVLKLYRAQEVSPEESPELHKTVERLAERARIPKPRVYIIPTDAPNAFATGRDPKHAAVAVTQGIMRLLNRDELEGVLAHELSHVKNRDTMISTVVAIMAGLIMMLASVARWGFIFAGARGSRDNAGGALGALFLMIVAPIAAMLIQFAISRSREYKADASGGTLCRSPMSLARALEKIDHAARHHRPIATPATSHLFIVNPLTKRSIMTLFSTHPATQDRVQKLTELAQKSGRV